MSVLEDNMRTARLGTSHIELQGELPLPGERLEADFTIPVARAANRPLVPSDLQEGCAVVD